MTSKPESCTINTRFILNGEVIYVIKSADEQIPNDCFTTCGKRIRTVILGEPEHMNALSQIEEELVSKKPETEGDLRFS